MKTSKDEYTFIASNGKRYFKRKQYLKKYIKEQLENENLFKDYQIFEDIDSIGIEYPIKSRKIDLLLENKKDKSLLAIVLKSGMGKENSETEPKAGWTEFGQVSIYLALLETKFRSREIKGCIIAPMVYEGLKIAAIKNENVKIYEYQIDAKGKVELDLKSKASLKIIHDKQNGKNIAEEKKAKTSKEGATFIASNKKRYFIEEKYLQERIKEQIETLFPKYKIFEDVDGIGIEYPIKYQIESSISSRKIDLLLENKKDGSLLAIELKSRTCRKESKIEPKIADRREFGQISMYLALLEKKFGNSKIIKGCIIAPVVYEGLKTAALTNKNVMVCEYQVDAKGNIELDPKPN